MGKLKAGDTFLDHAGNLCTVRENGTLRVTTVNELPSLTIQSEADSCDINKIVAKFKTTGLMTNLAKSLPRQGDFSEACDYHSAMNQVVAANEAFMTLPAALRKRFSNDPGQLLSFLENEDNRSEAIKLGLVKAPQDTQVPQGASAPAPEVAG